MARLAIMSYAAIAAQPRVETHLFRGLRRDPSRLTRLTRLACFSGCSSLGIPDLCRLLGLLCRLCLRSLRFCQLDHPGDRTRH